MIWEISLRSIFFVGIEKIANQKKNYVFKNVITFEIRLELFHVGHKFDLITTIKGK